MTLELALILSVITYLAWLKYCGMESSRLGRYCRGSEMALCEVNQG